MSSDIFIQAKQDGKLSSDHLRISDVLSEQGKRDLEALESYERALIIMKEHYSGDAKKLASLYQWIGVVHARLGNWGEGIDYHKLAYSSIGTYTNATDSHFHAILCEEIGLDQYFWDKRLHQNT